MVNTWSLAGYIAGFLISAGMYWRYFVVYDDVSQGVLYVFAGLVIIALSWLYDRYGTLKDKVEILDTRLFDFEGYVNENLNTKQLD